MDYYENWKSLYKAASLEERNKSKVHWLKCHAENLESGRHDLIIHSAQILAHIAIVENERSAK